MAVGAGLAVACAALVVFLLHRSNAQPNSASLQFVVPHDISQCLGVADCGEDACSVVSMPCSSSSTWWRVHNTRGTDGLAYIQHTHTGTYLQPHEQGAATTRHTSASCLVRYEEKGRYTVWSASAKDAASRTGAQLMPTYHGVVEWVSVPQVNDPSSGNTEWWVTTDDAT